VTGKLGFYKSPDSRKSSVATERDAPERRGGKRLADRYWIALRAIGEVVWEWDLEDSAVHWNGTVGTFGYEPRDVESTVEWWTERLAPDDVERVRHGINAAIDSGRPIWEEEYRFRRKSGTYADVSARGVIVRDKAGKAVRVIGSLQDITQKKRHEREAAQLAERLQSATAAAAVGTWRLDVKTEFFLADANLNRLISGEDEERIQRFSDVIRVVHPDDRAGVAQAFEESIATGRPCASDHRVVLANGEVRWLRCRGRLLLDGRGAAETLTGAVADITELKRAEESMGILADASRLLVESLDVEEVLSSMTRMAVPGFADAVVIHLKDSPSGELRFAAVHVANPELLATLREMLRTGSFRVGVPGRRVVQTGHAELHPTVTSAWVSGAGRRRRHRVSDSQIWCFVADSRPDRVVE
jgi:PAS domain S-box-containing protein